ncbi:MAG: hypothetical protein EB828_06560 [Nitrosopumilus sp. D6]|nr:MAG: hypothetical protein EB828_06560 [Nitrosopumilus sp. D6]
MCDWYVVYGSLKVRQRCWAHMLRKSKVLAKGGSREVVLHEKLQKLLHAKLAPPDQKIRDIL